MKIKSSDAVKMHKLLSKINVYELDVEDAKEAADAMDKLWDYVLAQISDKDLKEIS